MTQWPAQQIEMRAPCALKPNPRNSQTHPESQIAAVVASIKQFGFTIPVLVTEPGMLIAGDGRVQAAKRIELDAIPVMVARGWSEAQVRAYTIADNRLAEMGQWDPTLLEQEFTFLTEETDLAGLVGFEQDDIADMLSDGSYQPILNPHRGRADVTHEQVNSAQANLAGQFEGGRQSLVPVTCPNCGYDHYVDAAQVKLGVNNRDAD